MYEAIINSIVIMGVASAKFVWALINNYCVNMHGPVTPKSVPLKIGPPDQFWHQNGPLDQFWLPTPRNDLRSQKWSPLPKMVPHAKMRVYTQHMHGLHAH